MVVNTSFSARPGTNHVVRSCLPPQSHANRASVYKHLLAVIYDLVNALHQDFVSTNVLYLVSDEDQRLTEAAALAGPGWPDTYRIVRSCLPPRAMQTGIC